MKLRLPDWRDPRVRPRIITGLLTALIAILFVAAAMIGLFSTTGFCGLCHEMSPDINSLGKSSHAQLTCYACHQQLSVPNLLFHKVLAMKELYLHFTNSFEKPINAESLYAEEGKVSNDNCNFCHSILTRKVTPSEGVIINHEVHLKKGILCVKCHNRVAHPDTEAGMKYEDWMKMDGCVRCHKQKENSPAPGACKTCHPKNFQLKPGNHLAAGFMPSGHWKLRKEKPKYCEMCHNQKVFCFNCHGMEMPHPANWKKAHRTIGKQKPGSCTLCHKGGNFCSGCHHGITYNDPPRWIREHKIKVKKTGAQPCFQCHQETFCSHCHVRGSKA